MKRLWPFLILLCVAATVPPMPLVPNRNHVSAAVSQGDAASKLIAKISAPAAPRTNTLTWVYPPSINPSNYWWDIQFSTDLKTWTTLVTNASGVTEITANQNFPLLVFRLSAKFSP